MPVVPENKLAKEKLDMKKHVTVLAGVFAMSLAVPALAGPNWPVIQEARKASQQHMPADANSHSGEVLPLDHGPRARTTPWLNKQREQEILAQSHHKHTPVLASHSQSHSSHT
jgi:hypothetical protein